MKTIYFNVETMDSLLVGNQYDHCARQVEFTKIDYDGDLFIKVHIDDYDNLICLNDNKFIIGKPLTLHHGAVTCQLYSKILGEDEYEELSDIFYLIIEKSIEKDVSEYPLDPNYKGALEEELLKMKEVKEQLTELIGNAQYEISLATQTLAALQSAISEAHIEQIQSDIESLKTRTSTAESMLDKVNLTNFLLF